jgi:hypothetical protein
MIAPTGESDVSNVRDDERGDMTGILMGSAGKSSDLESSREVSVSNSGNCGMCKVVLQDSKTLGRVVGSNSLNGKGTVHQ